MSNLVLVISAAIYFQISYLILNKISEHVPKSYMDEIFHVPQAQEYCLGNYNSWNDKITTLPGLYLLSTSLFRLIGLVFKEENILSVCNTFNLRLTNIVLSTLNFVLIYKIYYHLNKKKLNENNTLYLIYILKKGTIICLASAISISIFPLNYFFQFLYYTDTGSTFFVLLAYYLHLQENYKLAGLSISIAILFRQTNIVWVTFFLILILLSNADTLVKKTTKSKVLVKSNSDSSQISIVANQRNKKTSNLFDLISRTPIEATDFELGKFLTKLYKEDFWGKKLIYNDLYNVFNLDQMQPYLMSIALFVFFLFTNNGIVVGDRSNHKASFHLSQLLYFWLFTSVLTTSSLVLSLKKIKNLLFFLVSNVKVISLVAVPIILIVIKNFTYEHPFLLADNRHFTFYIWSRVFKQYEFVRYALAPLYLVSIYLFYRNLTSTGKSIGWLLAFTLCLFVSLVPQQLIEFRYFIIPFYLYRLNVSQFSLKEILIEFLLNLMINFSTIHLFLNRVFYWHDSPDEQQRFMW